jgi:arginase
VGQSLSGTSAGPRALRALGGLEAGAQALGWRWADRGDFGGGGEPSPSPAAAAAASTMRNAAAVGTACGAVFAACAAAACAGDFVLCAGGDHSVSAGSVAGALAARPSLGCVWVDAHADINSPRSSPSGNAHGMPVSLLLGGPPEGGGDAWRWLAGAPRLAPAALVYVGLRDVDAGEVAAIRELGILAFTMADVDRLGIAAVARAVGRRLAGRALHASLDVDALDPSVVQATGTAVPGGLTFREAHFLLEALAATQRLCSLDVVEVNPLIGARARVQRAPADAAAAAGDNDDDDADLAGFTAQGAATARVAASFALSALGKTTLPPPATTRKRAKAPGP